MRITINKGELKNALGTVSKYAGNATANLACVRIDATDDHAYFAATNMDESAQCRASALIDEDGCCLISAKRLGEIVNVMPEAAVTIDADESHAEIICGGSRFEIPALDPEDFPGIQSVEEESKITLLYSTYCLMVSKAANFAAKPSSNRSVIEGILLEVGEGRVCMVATNSYSIFCTESDAQGEFSCVIPAPFAKVTASAQTDARDVTIAFGGNVIRVEVGDYTFTSRAYSKNFPNYRQLIPESMTSTATVNGQTLAGALKRASVIGNATPVAISIEDGTATFSADEKESGRMSEEFECRSDGAIEIKVNAAYALDAVNAMAGFDVTLGYNGALKPLVFKAGRSLAIVMPVR
ncbi:MAG: DNA polymerase III subunit beta [Clostridia bacterium]|nr:DNA polymerase III subunit beta [Clostridia bacterium]